MGELKTKANSASAQDFLNSTVPEERRKDLFELLHLFEQVTGEKGVLWGESIVGFGNYHYESIKSSQKGEWPLTAFSPRKDSISIYIMPDFESYTKELSLLGKHKKSKGSCLYIKKIQDIDLSILSTIIADSVSHMRDKYTK